MRNVTSFHFLYTIPLIKFRGSVSLCYSTGSPAPFPSAESSGIYWGHASRRVTKGPPPSWSPPITAENAVCIHKNPHWTVFCRFESKPKYMPIDLSDSHCVHWQKAAQRDIVIQQCRRNFHHPFPCPLQAIYLSSWNISYVSARDLRNILKTTQEETDGQFILY